RVVAQGTSLVGIADTRFFLVGPFAEAAGLALEGSQRRPVFGSADDLADQRDEDHALVAALEAELAAQVAELAELAAAEAGSATADAQVDRPAAGETEAGTA